MTKKPLPRPAAAREFDDIDLTLLEIAQENSSRTFEQYSVELANRKHSLSSQACRIRLSHLKDDKVITAERAILDRAQLGYDMVAFMLVKMKDKRPNHLEEFVMKAEADPNILEVHEAFGETDYIVKVIGKGRPDILRTSKKLSQLNAEIKTMIVAETAKETTIVKLRPKK